MKVFKIYSPDFVDLNLFLHAKLRLCSCYTFNFVDDDKKNITIITTLFMFALYVSNWIASGVVF